MKTTISDIKQFFARSKYVQYNFNTPVRYRLLHPSIGNRIDAVFAPAKLKRQELKLTITERVIEYPFVFRNLQANTGLKVFDFGCAESLLSYQLVSNGHWVTGIDLREYYLPHKNFQFIQGDLFTVELPENEFDTVIAVSALEHIGLSGYGNIPEKNQTDSRAVEIFSKILKPGGQLILTVPAGKSAENNFLRVYDDDRLTRLLAAFEIIQMDYYAKQNTYEWEQVSAAEIGKYSWIDKYDENGAYGVACVAARVMK